MFSPIFATTATRSASKIRVRIRRKFPGDVVAERAEAVILATKSVSQLISTSTPTLAPGAMCCAMTPSFAARLAFFSAEACLFCAVIHGGFDVAVRLDERLFAIHQARAGHFAELADICRSDFSHNNSRLLKVKS